jgi:cellulose synthase/poly-beta-1,6-N-acetylglucosamine synthase-like glycosyltransferase
VGHLLTLQDLALLVCLLGTWGLLGVHFLLTVAGYFYARRAEREKQGLPAGIDYPSISLLVPAHDEELVIAGTLETLLHLDYPRERMEILVIEDSSRDETRRIVEEMMLRDRRLKLISVPPGLGGRGKSNALNLGLRYASHEIIGVFDADNCPEPESLKYLVAQLVLRPELAAAVGKVRTLNRRANFLTRCINIEFISFQWILQAGRWHLLRLAALPGTNYVVRREALERVGAWDESALADDAELTLRLRQEGYQIKFVPYAVTWEPEPESWAVWARQRLRWVRGGNYVVKKFLPRLRHLRRWDLALDVVHLFSLYYYFFALLLLSDLLFLGGLAFLSGRGMLGGPLLWLWGLAFALFWLQMAVTLSLEGEHSPGNLLLAGLMYFSYCQVWIYIAVKGHLLDLLRPREFRWDKTTRVKLPSQARALR